MPFALEPTHPAATRVSVLVLDASNARSHAQAQAHAQAQNHIRTCTAAHDPARKELVALHRAARCFGGPPHLNPAMNAQANANANTNAAAEVYMQMYTQRTQCSAIVFPESARASVKSPARASESSVSPSSLSPPFPLFPSASRARKHTPTAKLTAPFPHPPPFQNRPASPRPSTPPRARSGASTKSPGARASVSTVGSGSDAGANTSTGTGTLRRRGSGVTRAWWSGSDASDLSARASVGFEADSARAGG